MSAEQNKALIRRLYETQKDVGRGKADIDALDEMMAADYVSHSKLNSPAATATSRRAPRFLPPCPTSGSSSRIK